MMATYLVTIALIFSLALVGIVVDRLYRRFAARNPRLGPFRDPGKCGCCKAADACDAASAGRSAPTR